jgi:hypothetical protein
MAAILVVSIFLIVFFSLLFYRRRRFEDQQVLASIPPPPPSLFPPDQEQLSTARDEQERVAAKLRVDQLLERASQGEREVLVQIDRPGEPEVYDAVLTVLADHEGADDFLGVSELAAFVIEHDLPANRRLVERVMDHCRHSPDRSAAIMLLHLAARTDDAEVFGEAFDLLADASANGTVPALSAIELVGLADSEFWLLRDDARDSGAGFLLKQKLAGARRELAAAARPENESPQQ